MKTLLIIALAGAQAFAAPALAAGTHATSGVEYSNPVFTEALGADISQAQLDVYFDHVQAGALLGYAGFPVNGSGTIDHTILGSRYRQSTSAPDDSETASGSAGGAFTLKGQVSADCSFYNGASADHVIDLGAIGVRTGDADNVTVAFNQAATATAHVDTATAGCNTRNIVSISEQNAGRGLVNANPGNYDTAQFTAHIPYTLTATWTGAGNATANGTTQTLSVPASGSGQNAVTGGAWRSAFNMDVAIPPQPLGLVAGQYQDRIVVTLAVS